MVEYFKKIVEIIRQTNIPEQMSNVDFNGLLHNPWFMVPFVFLFFYLIYKKEFNIMAIIAIGIIIWYFTGTEFMSNLIVGGEIQVNKILPIVFGGAIALIIVVYLLLNRD